MSIEMKPEGWGMSPLSGADMRQRSLWRMMNSGDAWPLRASRRGSSPASGGAPAGKAFSGAACQIMVSSYIFVMPATHVTTAGRHHGTTRHQ